MALTLVELLQQWFEQGILKSKIVQAIISEENINPHQIVKDLEINNINTHTHKQPTAKVVVLHLYSPVCVN